MKGKKLDLTTILIIIVVIVIIFAAILLITKKGSNVELKCLVNSTNTYPTNEDVELHIYVRGNNATLKQSEGITKSDAYYQMTVSKNDIYSFYVTDGKKEETCSIEVSNINKNAPSGKITSNTTKRVTALTLTLIADSKYELDKKPYSWDGKNYSKTNTLKVTKNGTYIGYIKDKYGNIGTAKYKVTNIGSALIKATGITLNAGNASIEVKKTATLRAIVSPSNANDYKVTWSSSDTKIATVDANGKVTGVAAGKAIVTAKLDNGKTANCNIFVVNEPSYSCSSGYYLGANATSCTLCEANYYCPGGSFVKSSSIQGRNACPSGQTSSAGASSCNSPSTYVITKDSKYSSYKNVASYDSATLKYRIIVYQGQDIVLIWAKDPRNQMHSALATSDGLHSKAGDVILKNEISTYGYQNKGMVAVNASFYRPIDNPNGTPWEGVLISHGKIVKNRDTCSGTIGLNSSGTLKLYYNETAEALYSYGFRDTFVVSNTTAADNSTDYANRTQICQIDKNNFAILSGDGQVKACGQQLMGLTGCSVAFNLDGGGSRKLYYKTATSSLSCRFTGDRIIPDMLYFVEQ